MLSCKSNIANMVNMIYAKHQQLKVVLGNAFVCFSVENHMRSLR